MNKLFLFSLGVLLIILSGNTYSQNNAKSVQEKYSQVRIFATSDNDFRRIQASGLDLDAGIHKKGLYYETWLSETEIGLLNKSGVSYQITIPDWMEYYNSFPKMTQAEVKAALEKSKLESNVYHSIYGTMGGHLKVAEIIAKLDSLRLQYPTLVSARGSIGNTYEGRSMWTVRITKNPDNPTGRPEIWLNGVTHAREPLGMENVLYFVYWLVENYGSDPIATYILNNREIYWTPIINVDGYYYNETTNPNGGGQWRKNRSPQGSSYGVDLNRNFGTWNFWNSTNGGSSTTQSSDTYRGPYPFSEVETQNFRTFLNSRNFRVGLDYHTYGNYLIKPYAWCDPTPTPDDAIYNQFGQDIIAVNHFTFGTPYQTVNYFVRGGDIDWCYSTDSTGHSTHRFFMTPEVGVIGFWPPQANIIPEAQTCLEMNKYYCLVAGAYPSLVSSTLNKSTYVQGESGTLKIVYKNKGLENAQNIKIEFLPLSSYVNIPVQVYTKSLLAPFTSDSTIFNFSISGSAPNSYGIPTRIRIKLNDTSVVYEKVMNILVGSGITTFADSAENGTSNWTFGTGWGINTTNYHTPTHSFAYPNYGVNVNSSMSLNFPLNLSAYPVAYLQYWHRYDMESGYDFCYVELSNDNGSTWQQVSSYTGTNNTWTQQTFDVTSMIGGSNNVRIRFRLTSDGGLQNTGWYVDDIKITNYYGPVTGIGNMNPQIPSKFSLEQNYPNPFNPSTQINYAVPKDGTVKITVYDVLGREVRTLVNEVKKAGYYSVEFDGGSFSSGFYFYKMEGSGFVETKKMMLVK